VADGGNRELCDSREIADAKLLGHVEGMQNLEARWIGRTSHDTDHSASYDQLFTALWP
jgi:hypothetical protein